MSVKVSRHKGTKEDSRRHKHREHKHKKSAGPKSKPIPEASVSQSCESELTGFSDSEVEKDLKPTSQEDEDEEEKNEDQDSFAGFSSDEDDLSQIPPASSLSKPAPARKNEGAQKPGTIYVGRLPHGFYNDQMRAYFSQFGTITRLRMARNRKTGRSKHYAFIEFESGAVAEIVARTMNNYLLFGHILKVCVVPPEKIHEDLWKNASRKFRVIPRSRIQRQKLESPSTDLETWQRRVKSTKSRRAKQLAAVQALGYSFKLPELKTLPTGPGNPQPEEEKKKRKIPTPTQEDPPELKKIKNTKKKSTIQESKSRGSKRP